MKTSIRDRDNALIREARGTTIKYEDSRTGKTQMIRDKKRNALLPGKRISKSGKIYYEKRRNRSDLLGKDI